MLSEDVGSHPIIRRLIAVKLADREVMIVVNLADREDMIVVKLADKEDMTVGIDIGMLGRHLMQCSTSRVYNLSHFYNLVNFLCSHNS